MNLLKCDKCKNRYIMCCICSNSDKYIKSDFSHDEYIKRMAVEDFATEVLETLEKEFRLSDSEKHRCIKENPLQFDYAKGYVYGIYNAIQVIKEKLN